MSGRARTKSRGRSVQKQPFKLKGDSENDLSVSALKTPCGRSENVCPGHKKKPVKPVSRSNRATSRGVTSHSVENVFLQKPVKPTKLKLNPKKYALHQIADGPHISSLLANNAVRTEEKDSSPILSQKQLNLQHSKLELARMSRACPDLLETASHKRNELHAAQHLLSATKKFRSTQIVNK